MCRSSALGFLGGFAAHQLVEVALVAAGGGLLIEQRETALIELLEELVPVDVLQGLLPRVSREIKTQDSHVIIVAGSPYASGLRATLFGPAADLVMISTYTRLCSRHSAPLPYNAGGMRCTWDGLA